jgi:hypothetical protein
VKDQSVTFGQNQPRDLTRLVAALSAFPKDVALRVVWGEAKRERTDSQNSALFGVCYKALAEFTGHTAAELHDMFLRSYFGEVEKTVMGTTITVPARTTTTDHAGKKSKLSTKEFNVFYEFIQSKGAEIGCYVPSPDPRFGELKEMREATT